ncbi:MAG: hemolysin family protein [Actinomycetota bacterium]|nr:hemolysin family protein [Actinomycetota bacterium]
MSTVLEAVLIALLLLGACLLSSVQRAVGSITRVKAHHLLDQKRLGAGRLLRMVEDPAPYQNAVGLFMILALTTATVLAFDAFAGAEEARRLAAVTAMTLLAFIFVVAVPRSLSSKRLEQVGLALAAPTYALGRVLRPIGTVVARIVRFPRTLLSRGGDEGDAEGADDATDDSSDDEDEIEEEERELIHSVFEFGDTLVREVMVPRTDMVVVKSDATLVDALDTITNAGYSRIPIYEGDTDNIVGVLYAKDLLKRSVSRDDKTKVSVLGRAPLFVPEQKKVSDLLREMQHARIHMAIVVDEYGGTAGLVTIEDLIEEIVGEIVDEYDQEEPLVEPLEGDSIRVSARLPIDEVNELLGVELPHEEWDTVGGLVFGLTGRVPSPGERISYDSLEFQTERVTGRRIQKVVIRKVVGSDDEDAAGP